MYATLTLCFANYGLKNEKLLFAQLLKLPCSVCIVRLHVTFAGANWGWRHFAICMTSISKWRNIINEVFDRILWNSAKVCEVFTGFIIYLYFSSTYFAFSTWTYPFNISISRNKWQHRNTCNTGQTYCFKIILFGYLCHIVNDGRGYVYFLNPRQSRFFHTPRF